VMNSPWAWVKSLSASQNQNRHSHSTGEASLIFSCQTSDLWTAGLDSYLWSVHITLDPKIWNQRVGRKMTLALPVLWWRFCRADSDSWIGSSMASFKIGKYWLEVLWDFKLLLPLHAVP
jgi:hypothetical protein